MVVEERTLNNSKSQSLFKGEGSVLKKSLWTNFARLASEILALRDLSSLGYGEDARNLCTPHISKGMMQ